jgi:hypothetical protein
MQRTGPINITGSNFRRGRHRRVVEVRRELVANHECDHPGRWERQEGYQMRDLRYAALEIHSLAP